jgi:hypothetical protein
MTAIETMPDNCGALIDIVENAKTSLYDDHAYPAFGRQGVRKHVREVSDIGNSMHSRRVHAYDAVATDRNLCNTVASDVSTQPTASRARQDVQTLAVYGSHGTYRPRLGSHRAGGRVDVRDITEKFVHDRSGSGTCSTCRNYDVVGHGKFM